VALFAGIGYALLPPPLAAAAGRLANAAICAIYAERRAQSAERRAQSAVAVVLATVLRI
jgi:hypothetical protein